jgi:hypothetical protein
MTMKLSARNIIKGKIVEVTKGQTTAHVRLDVGGAMIPRPDLLAAGHNGSIYSASASGSVYRIAASGEAAVFHTGFRQVRGVAYDESRHRVFVVDHDADESDGIRNLLHVLPDD